MITLGAAVWFKLIGLCALLPMMALALFLLFGSADLLYRGVSWMPLPLPEKDTRLHAVLITFWRALGGIILLCVMFMLYIVLFQMQ